MSAELAAIRRELSILIQFRHQGCLSAVEALQYEDLCRRERELLGYPGALTRGLGRH